MKNLDRNSAAIYAAGLGLAVMLFAATFGRTSGAQTPTPKDRQPDSSAIVEPSEDPDLEPAVVEKKGPAPSAEAVIRKWARAPQLAARKMIGKYGEPTRASKSALVWIDNGPWRKTIVHRSAWPHLIGKGDKDFLEQTAALAVPIEKIDDLKRFDSRLEVNQGAEEVSARSESEPTNFLLLNLAHEIAAGSRTVDDAREFAKRTERLSQAGKSSSYTEGLLFQSGRVRSPGSEEHGMTP